MAVPKMRNIGQDDSEEEQKKPQPQRYLVQPSEEEPTQMTQTAPNKFNVQPQSVEPGMPVIHIHMAPTQMKSLPVYDDGGDVGSNGGDSSGGEVAAPSMDAVAGQQAGPGTEAGQVAEMAQGMSGQAATPKLSLGGRVTQALGRLGKMDTGGNVDPNSMPGQTAQTRQYAVQGLDHVAPIMDSGGVVQPQDDEAAGIAAKKQNIEEYEKATHPVEEPVRRESGAPDKINPKAKYGDKPGEERIDVSGMTKPLGSTRMAPIYDDGGPVKNDPNDGHHQVAVLEEGERVLTPEQNAQYEQEHGAPADFAGPVLQQPNPPVRPMMDTEREAEQPVGGAKMDVSNPPAADVEPAMARTISNTPAATRPTMAPIGQPQEQPAQGPTAAHEAGHMGGAAEPLPQANPLSHEGPALPSDHDTFQREKAALKQRMIDAAEGKNNNGKFDHVAYGEAKMALADLEKANPYGSASNHPSVLGKIGHGLARAGEIASDVVLGPNITARIPGTRENLNAQEAAGQQQVTQGLAGKASEAETALKTAQAEVAGRPKDPKAGIAFETFNVNHTQPGTPEHQRALDNLAFYQKQDKEMNENKAGSKREKLPEQIDAKAREVLSYPEGSPERAKAQGELDFLKQQQQQSQKLQQRDKEIRDHAISMGLNPDDPKDYNTANLDLEGKKTGVKAEAGLPVWKTKAQIQDQYATSRALLVQRNAKTDDYAKEAHTEQMKADNEFGERIAPLVQLQNLLKVADENTVASNIIPWMTTMGILKEGKINRLNQTELGQLSPAMGSLYRWANAHADKLAAGELPDSYKTDVGGIVQSLIDEANDVHKTKTLSIDKNLGQYGQNLEVQNTPKGGTTIKPSKTTPNTPALAPHKVGDIITQGNKKFKATKVDVNGKVTAAEAVK